MASGHAAARGPPRTKRAIAIAARIAPTGRHAIPASFSPWKYWSTAARTASSMPLDPRARGYDFRLEAPYHDCGTTGSVGQRHRSDVHVQGRRGGRRRRGRLGHLALAGPPATLLALLAAQAIAQLAVRGPAPLGLGAREQVDEPADHRDRGADDDEPVERLDLVVLRPEPERDHRHADADVQRRVDDPRQARAVGDRLQLPLAVGEP